MDPSQLDEDMLGEPAAAELAGLELSLAEGLALDAAGAPSFPLLPLEAADDDLSGGLLGGDAISGIEPALGASSWTLPPAAGPADEAASSAGAVPAGQLQPGRQAVRAADLGDVDADPIAYLEAAIEADKPKVDLDSELQAVLEAVAAEAALPGAAMLLPAASAAAAAAGQEALGRDGTADASGAAPQQQQQQQAGSRLHHPTPAQFSTDADAAMATPDEDHGQVGAGHGVRSSPDIVLQGLGSSGDTSPGSEAAQQGLLSGQLAQHAEQAAAEPPLWTLLEEEEGQEQEPTLAGEAGGWEEGGQLAGVEEEQPMDWDSTGRNDPAPDASAGSSEDGHSLERGFLDHTEPVAAAESTLSAAGDVGRSGGDTGSEVESAEQRRRQTFNLLQPVCSVLLQHRTSPAELTQLLAGLGVLAGELDSTGLRGCLDYLLFPLLLCLDSIAEARQPHQAGGAVGPPPQPPLPAMASDQAAEAALSCLRAVVERCGGCARGDQLTTLLQRLAGVLMVPPGRASEEVRLQALLCVEALLAEPLAGAAAPSPFAVLCEQESAPLLGHMASLLLQCADAEVQAGQGGSRAVRAAALAALRRLIAAIGSGEALAFFVPGIVTGLGKALAAAGSAGGPRSKSGAAASSAAAVEALRALTQILVATLNSKFTQAAWESRHQGGSGSSSREADAGGGAELGCWGGGGAAGGESAAVRLDAGAAMAQLRQLSLKAASSGAAASSSSTGPLAAAASSPATSAGSNGTAAAQAGTAPSAQPSASPSASAAPAAAGQPGQLRVDVNWAWVEATAARVHEVLRVVVPPLCSHPKPAVREALATACATLLGQCSRALTPSTSQLLSEALFSLAQDEWPDVAEVARSWLQAGSQGQGQEPGGPSHTVHTAPSLLPASVVGSSLVRLAEELPGALRCGDQQGILHARKLTTCIQVCPPASFAADVLGQPSRLATLFTALAAAFEFEPSSAALLAHMPPEAGAAYESGKLLPSSAALATSAGQPAQQQMVVLAEGSSGSCTGEAAEAGVAQADSSGRAAAAAAVAVREGGAVVAVQLPRMPLGLALIQTGKAYEAVAGACRAAAAAAAAASDGGGASATGSTALLRLLDHGIRLLQQIIQQRDAPSTAEAASDALVPSLQHEQQQQQQPWQLRAASVVAVLSEMVFGASPAAARDWQSAGRSSMGKAQEGSTAASQELQSLVSTLLEVLVGGGLWGLPTWQDSAPSGGGASTEQAPPLTAQQLGENVLAARVAVEAVGACARALGPCFARNGRLLRTVLLPLLEHLGDPAPLVASAAGASVGSLCMHCGFGTLSRLVGDNADYVVDGVCRQLRQVDRYPRAPQLLAVLMHKAGVAPELLPLLAEPARSAVQGVSILARRRQPQHVLAFLLALGEIMQGAGACAEVALHEMSQLALDVQAQWEEGRRAAQDAEDAREEAAAAAAAKAAAAAAAEAASEAGTNVEEGESKGLEHVWDYFLQRQRKKQQREEAGGLEAEGDEGGSGGSRVELSEEQRALMLLRKRRVHAAASLAQSAVDCCGPLALSSSLQVAVQALRVCVAGLRCLRATTLVLELGQYKVDPFVLAPADLAPPDPITPKLLPSVHLLWSPLMGTLKDWRVPLLEAALGTLSDLGSIAGSFISRRFGQEAWPLLQRLLKDGPPGRHIIAPGQDDLTSPAAVQRVRCAVLACLRAMAQDAGGELAVAGSSGGGAEVVAPLTGAMLPVVADWMSEKQAAVVRERATQAFMAMAKLDSDTAWTLLTTALAAHPKAQAMQVGGSWPPRCPDPALLPSFQKLCPPPPLGTVPAGMLECGAAKLAAMLAQVEKMGARWQGKSGGSALG